jgi:hypothetical protein
MAGRSAPSRNGIGAELIYISSDLSLSSFDRRRPAGGIAASNAVMNAILAALRSSGWRHG